MCQRISIHLSGWQARSQTISPTRILLRWKGKTLRLAGQSTAFQVALGRKLGGTPIRGESARWRILLRRDTKTTGAVVCGRSRGHGEALPVPIRKEASLEITGGSLEANVSSQPTHPPVCRWLIKIRITKSLPKTLHGPCLFLIVRVHGKGAQKVDLDDPYRRCFRNRRCRPERWMAACKFCRRNAGFVGPFRLRKERSEKLESTQSEAST